MPLALRDARALTFDCYGTLIDWERGILESLRPWANHHGLRTTDQELLEEFGRAESRIERHHPELSYTEVLKRVHRALARSFDIIENREDAARFAVSVGDWPPFSDTVDALKALGSRYRLCIISNTDRASFAKTQMHLPIEFAVVVMAEQVGAYKPDHRMFQRAFSELKSLGITPDKIIHVAQSLYHDHVPAKALGLTTVWVNCYRDQRGSGATVRPDGDVRPDYVVTSLRELADLCGV